MPANMISAPVGSILVVSGSSMATVSAGPTPGSTPIAVPSVTPTKPQNRLIGASATPKPASSALSVSPIASQPRRAEDRLQPARRQVDVEELDEEEEHRQAEQQPDSQVAQRSGAAEATRDAAVEDHRRQHEARAVDQRHLREQAAADPGEGAGVEGVLAALGGIVRHPLPPAAGEDLGEQPYAQQDQACRDHLRREVRADACVAACLGQA